MLQKFQLEEDSVRAQIEVFGLDFDHWSATDVGSERFVVAGNVITSHIAGHAEIIKGPARRPHREADPTLSRSGCDISLEAAAIRRYYLAACILDGGLAGDGMPQNYVPIFIFIAVVAVMIPLPLILAKLVRPDNPGKEKLMPYECGIDPLGQFARPLYGSLLHCRHPICGLRRGDHLLVSLGGPVQGARSVRAD